MIRQHLRALPGNKSLIYELLPPLLATLLLFTPTYLNLSAKIWTQEQYSHGTIIPLIFIWLIWRSRHWLEWSPTQPDRLWGSLLMLGALLILAIGRRGALPFFETLAQIPYFWGLMLYLKGHKAASFLRFPLFFLLFMVPLPGIVMYNLTSTLKEWNAQVVIELLYHLGYPVARDGVVLLIGRYQLFLADACAGINSLYALSALGLLFIYLAKGRSTLRKLILAATIIPIALVTNLVRVSLTLLITYHFNDAIAERIHSLLGYLLFLLALGILFLIENRLLESPR